MNNTEQNHMNNTEQKIDAAIALLSEIKAEERSIFYRLLEETLAKNKQLESEVFKWRNDTSVLGGYKHMYGEQKAKLVIAESDLAHERTRGEAWYAVYNALCVLPQWASVDKPELSGRQHALATIEKLVEEIRLKDADIEAKAKFIAVLQQEKPKALWRLLDDDERFESTDQVQYRGETKWRAMPYCNVGDNINGTYTDTKVRRRTTEAEQASGFRSITIGEHLLAGDEYKYSDGDLWTSLAFSLSSDVWGTAPNHRTHGLSLRRKIVPCAS